MNTILKDRVRNAMTQSRDCDHLLHIAEGACKQPRKNYQHSY